MHDLVIDNATVIDGLGGAARPGGVAVKDGRIAAVGTDLGSARERVDAGRLVLAPGIKVKAPRVAEAPISMECKLVRILPVGIANLILGEVVQWHVRDDIYDTATGRFDMHRLKPVGRLTGNLYSHIHQIFEMKRPNPNYQG